MMLTDLRNLIIVPVRGELQKVDTVAMSPDAGRAAEAHTITQDMQTFGENYP